MSESTEHKNLAPEEDVVLEKEPEIVVQDAVEASGGNGSTETEAPSVEDTLATLRRQLDEERSKRQFAERAAQEAAAKVFQAETEVEDNNLHLINNAIATVNANQNILKGNLKVAMASQDYDAVAEIQEEIAANRYRLEQLNTGKQSLESQPRREPPRPVMDPVEQFASQLSPRSAAWVRAHPECVRDQRMMQKMLAAHNMVTADGVQVDSDDYFTGVERLLGIQAQPSASTEAAEDPTSSAAKVVSRRSAPAAAPVSRSGNGTGTTNGRVTVVSLSQAQKEAAADMGMSYEEYARNLTALKREGKMH
jgi:hypothetical protein